MRVTEELDMNYALRQNYLIQYATNSTLTSFNKPAVGKHSAIHRAPYATNGLCFLGGGLNKRRADKCHLQQLHCACRCSRNYREAARSFYTCRQHSSECKCSSVSIDETSCSRYSCTRLVPYISFLLYLPVNSTPQQQHCKGRSCKLRCQSHLSATLLHQLAILSYT